jgi:apolipoprotein N-acyltransferase
MTSPLQPRTSAIKSILLLISCVALLTLSFAPVSQFYLAWIGLTPWLIFLANAKSQKSAFFYSWIAGTLFFTANMWWMSYISWPGMLALMIFCATYWGWAALVIRGAGLITRAPIIPGMLATAAVWVTFEWLRGIIFTGLPWLFLGHTQTPNLGMCQIADITGVYGISFWLVTLNALAAIAWLRRDQKSQLIRATGVVTGIFVAVLAYGFYRMHQTPTSLSPGPVIAVVQANYPQSNSGEKGATIQERLAFHKAQTIAALDKDPGKIDLVVWSETMMYPLNHEARELIPICRELYDRLSDLTSKYQVALLTGGDYDGDWKPQTRDGQSELQPTDKRNSAYFFDRDGQMNDAIGHRYDKIHLVPWGEYIPGKDWAHWLYQLSVTLGPKYYSDYVMQPGSSDALTVFHLKDDNHDWQFVTPICFEDIDARISSAMFRPQNGSGKRADFLVNLTNDGWFKANENAQHLQAASFRSIENRVWTARSVNTGISGFVDSNGQPTNLVGPRQTGTAVQQIMIDNRLTFYTKFGDIFAETCAALTTIIAAWAFSKRKRSNS